MAVAINEIEQYWARRADSYSDIVVHELYHDNKSRWMDVISGQLPKNKRLKILDIGTGPGFFAIGLAMLGHDVTAVDYTQAMLDKAKENAGYLANRIVFQRMDAHKLEFADNTFDAVVSRNLTWNLERPEEAYGDWHRVLKKGGILLNFDAGWYNYLFEEEKNIEFQRDRKAVAENGVFDFESYEESAVMEEISRGLVLSHCQRPQADMQMLRNVGFSKISVDAEVWRRTWDEVEKINFASTPMFMINAQK